MEHIKDNLKKYSNLKNKSDELVSIRAEIMMATGIEPESLKLKNKTLYIKAKNNYEAVELRMRIENINKLNGFDEAKIY